MITEPESLRSLSLFSALPDTALAEFCRYTQTLLFGADQTIYRPGDRNCPLYLVVAGKVRQFVTDEYGRTLILANVAPGGLLGEMPGSEPDTSATTAVTLVATRLIVLDRFNLSYLFAVRPDAALQLIGTLEARLRQAQALLRCTKSSTRDE